MDYPREVVCDHPVGLQDVMPTLLEAAGAPIPDSVTGRSVLPLMRAESPSWRELLHGEHAGQYLNDDGVHWLVGSERKYIWYSQTGQELLFDVVSDPNELHDLSAHEDLVPWRGRMAQVLAGRPEGFSDGKNLSVGRPHEKFVPGKGPR
jgi:arylsulfatase A-like enzyme